MNRKENEILNRTIGANGPSMGFGVVLMMAGIISTIGGIITMQYQIILIGILLLFLAAFFILSIDTISIDKTQNKLNIYKDYYVTSVGRSFHINEFKSVCIYYQRELYKPKNIKGANGAMNTVELKTFTVCLISNNGDKVIAKELGKIELAKQLQYILARKTGLELIEDIIREK